VGSRNTVGADRTLLELPSDAGPSLRNLLPPADFTEGLASDRWKTLVLIRMDVSLFQIRMDVSLFQISMDVSLFQAIGAVAGAVSSVAGLGLKLAMREVRDVSME
jgi:hypothetical protein